MKKITLAYFLFAGLGIYITVSGYKAGPGTSGYDCTGAETGLGNPAGCKTCHGTSATAGIAVAIELDSTGGVPTTHYTGGMTYTVKITGTNNTTNMLPQFGFQMGSIKGSVAVVTPMNEGAWSSPFPANTHYAPPSAGNYTVGVVEQTAALNPTTGTGGNGTTYSKSFTWIAPIAGTGTISFWAALNAVDGNGTDDTGDKWNTKSAVILEWPSGNGVASLSESSEINAFPNPVSDNLNLQLRDIAEGNYSLSVFDISGRKVLAKQIAVGSSSQMENIPCMNWEKGVYKAVIEKENFIKYVSVVKE